MISIRRVPGILNEVLSITAQEWEAWVLLSHLDSRILNEVLSITAQELEFAERVHFIAEEAPQ